MTNVALLLNGTVREDAEHPESSLFHMLELI